MKKEPIPHSDTLRQAKALPETVCVNCPNAVWHLTRSENKKEELRIFCLLMHALIDAPSDSLRRGTECIWKSSDPGEMPYELVRRVLGWR